MSPSRICTAFSYSNIILSESKKEALTSREEKEACWREEITWEFPSLGASVGGGGGALLLPPGARDTCLVFTQL